MSNPAVPSPSPAPAPAPAAPAAKKAAPWCVPTPVKGLEATPSCNPNYKPVVPPEQVPPVKPVP
jgi:hypothetical protein